MTHTAHWPFPKSRLTGFIAGNLNQAKAAELKPYFKYAMERWRIPDDARALAWINATHDYSRALRIYRAIWCMDQLI